MPSQPLYIADTVKPVDLLDQGHLLQLLDGPHRRDPVDAQQVGQKLLADLFPDQHLPVVGHPVAVSENQKKIADFPSRVVEIGMADLIHG